MFSALCIDSGNESLRPCDFIRRAQTDLLHQQENDPTVPSREPPHSSLLCLVDSPPKFSDQPLHLLPHSYHFSSRSCNFPARQLWNPSSPAFSSLIHPPPCTPSAAPPPTLRSNLRQGRLSLQSQVKAHHPWHQAQDHRLPRISTMS